MTVSRFQKDTVHSERLVLDGWVDTIFMDLFLGNEIIKVRSSEELMLHFMNCCLDSRRALIEGDAKVRHFLHCNK